LPPAGAGATGAAAGGVRRRRDDFGRLRIFRRELQIIHEEARLHVSELEAELGGEAALDFRKFGAVGNPLGDGKSLGFVQFHAASLMKFPAESSLKLGRANCARKFFVAHGLRSGFA